MDRERKSDEDDVPQLSEHTMAALMEFYAEQQAGDTAGQNSMVKENWQLSQFWYDETTTVALANEALRVAGDNGSIACISCPTLYVKLKETRPPGCVLTLLEYDQRFECHSDFVFYDYKEPLKLPDSLQANSFDVVVVDPPFLSEECLTKAALSTKHLAKDKIILCTGAIMEDIAKQVLGVTPCSFVPKHTNNLANDFRCYLNYKSDHL